MRSGKWLREIQRFLNDHGAEIYTIQQLPDHKVVYWSRTQFPNQVVGTFGGRTWQQAYTWMTQNYDRWGDIPKH